MGGDLAQPTNDLESDTLTDILVGANAGASYWIGEFQSDHIGQFVTIWATFMGNYCLTF